MKEDSSTNVDSLLKDTIILLCKTGMKFSSELKVQGLLGITLDNNDIVLVQINEVVTQENIDTEFKSIKLTDMTELQQDLHTSHGLMPSTVRKQTYHDDDDDNDECVARESGVEQQLDDEDVVVIKEEDTDEDVSASYNDNTGHRAEHYQGDLQAEFITENDFPDMNYSADGGAYYGEGNEQRTAHDPTVADSASYSYQAARYCYTAHSTARKIQKKTVPRAVRKRTQSNAGEFDVLSTFLHTCAYRNCGKQFKHLQHLRRHQTQKHGRIPVSRRAHIWTKQSEFT